ncbi:MAG: hypothetical protein JWN44_7218, partial [Myxococcales bacterium]|nr:hypothetical protein [Myxococcales bacterium]
AIVPPDLARLVDEGFETMDGCVVFRRLAKRMSTTKSSDFPDRTGRECFVNHLHVEDYTTAKDALELAATGFAFAKRLEEALRSRGEHFIIIVSSDAESCSVRFHKARDGESWLADDLDGYGDEALLVLEV